MEDESKKEGGQWVSLLCARRARDPRGAEEEMRGMCVAAFGPGCSLGAMPPDLREHHLTANPVEGILEIKKKEPLVLHVYVVVVVDGVGGVDDGLRAAESLDSKAGRQISCGQPS